VMELDPLYADTVVDRWQRFTGQPATRDDTGEPFPKPPPAAPEPMR
jgi:hypothetical protein